MNTWRLRFSLAILIGMGLLSGNGDAAARPNVIMIVADDLGLQLGCYGDTVAKTPNIDRLAADGTRFTRAYTTTASCSASRSVILTGLYNHATGHYGHAHADGHFSTYESVKSLPNILGEAGYRTCLVGKYHVSPDYIYKFEAERQEGTQGARNTVRMAENAKAWVAEKDDRPFFLYFCPTDPHRGGDASRFANSADYPGIAPVTYQPDQIVVPPWLPDKPEVRRELCEYYRAIARMDVGIGTLTQALKDLGQWDNTLILFLADNGPPFPGAKTTCYEPGINLPLIVRDPKQTKRGITSSAMVNWADLTPTILDYCGIKPPVAPPLRPAENTGKPATAGKPKPYQFHGRSFAGILGTEQLDGWDTLRASHTFHEVQMYYPMRVVREGDIKYIFNIADGMEYPSASDLYASPTWQGVVERNNPQEYYGRRTVEAYLHRSRHELYDLKADPHETKNLANDPAMAATLKRLQEQMQTWQKQTRDPWATKWTYE
ncbi:MAG TPA: sulfatase [Planctomycetaceae bacterium]|nr:sulfatase [Planctomycetaceae bacterium]